MGLELEISITSLSLKAFFAAKLKTQSQIWHNPFGILPKMGIIFPIGAGIGVSINLQSGIPMLTYFEVEAGFCGCASQIYSTDDDATAGAALGQQSRDYSSQVIPYGMQDDANGRRVAVPPPLGESSASIPGLEKIYCGEDEYGDLDPYGPEPTVFKIAIIANIAEGQIGVLLVMRNIYPVRLILMMFPFIPRPMAKLLIAARGVLDMITVKRFDVSLNPSPYPLFTRGGTEIKHGLLLDMIDFNFFKIILVRRVYLHVTIFPPGQGRPDGQRTRHVIHTRVEPSFHAFSGVI